MISKNAKDYCREDVSLIENYDKAVADKDVVWECHHRREITPDGLYSRFELYQNGKYFGVPASELIFLEPGEHSRLHLESRKNYILLVNKDMTQNKYVSLDGNDNLKKYNEYVLKDWQPQSLFGENVKNRFDPLFIRKNLMKSLKSLQHNQLTCDILRSQCDDKSILN